MRSVLATILAIALIPAGGLPCSSDTCCVAPAAGSLPAAEAECCCGTGGSCCDLGAAEKAPRKDEKPAAPAPAPERPLQVPLAQPEGGAPASPAATDSSLAAAASADRGFDGSPAELRLHLRHSVIRD